MMLNSTYFSRLIIVGVILLLSISLKSIHSFVPIAQQQQQHQWQFLLKSAVADDQETTTRANGIIEAEFTRESARLTKAKKLLQQVLIDKPEVGVTVIPPPSQTQVPKDKNGRSKSTSLASPNTNTEISNGGRLIEQTNGLQTQTSYVTRWARGVKVAEPLIKYDPIKAEKILFRQPTKWISRNIQIAFPIGYWAAGVVFDYLTGSLSSISRKKRAKQLLKAISGLGPAIIKGGQALASRPDLLPSEYLNELQKLQDDVPRFSNSKAFLTVEQELNITFTDVFELIEPEPIAAASIGQVYKARLLKNGDTVALKIQRPKCEEIIALDLYVLRWWSGIYSNIFTLLKRDINVQSIIDDFGELIYREIDYVAEAANAQRFSELYASIPEVFVPKIYSELTTSKVLTMEWVDGYRLTDSDSLSIYGLDTKKLVDTLVQCSLKQILENGFFHADPHAGNLLACPDGRLCYLDFGMMSYANSIQRNGFLLAVVHIVNRDWTELVKVYQKLGFIPTTDIDVKPIEVALENVLPDVLDAEISELNFKNVVNKLGDIMYTFPFSLPPFYIAIIRCLGVLEGLAIQVDPTSRIIKEAYPYVASRVLTDGSQDELKEALRRLALTPDGHVRWKRLESLLEEANKSSVEYSGYDVTAALDQLTDYIISDEIGSDALLGDLTNRIVNGADMLGTETIQYIFDVSRALSINDEIAAVKAFRSLQSILLEKQQQRQQQQNSNTNNIGKQVRKNIQDQLPPLKPSMNRFYRILSLLIGTTTTTTTASTTAKQQSQQDLAKFLPIIRKLAQDPKVQRTSSEIIARLGERILSRSLRAVFGLPQPNYSNTNNANNNANTNNEIDNNNNDNDDDYYEKSDTTTSSSSGINSSSSSSSSSLTVTESANNNR